MDMWNDISKKINEAADYTVRETEKLTGIAKLKYKLMNQRSLLSSQYEQIGRLHYSELHNDTQSAEPVDNSAEIAELCSKVDETLAEIRAAENELAVLKNVKTCSQCGVKIDREMAFCPRCGAKQ